MKIKTIYAYPIKSLRGVSLPSAALTRNGFPYDRRFMLLKDHHKPTKESQNGTQYQNMAVSKFPAMCLFTTSLVLPDEHNGTDGEIEVTYTNPQDKSTKTLKIPLQPDTSELEPFEVSMHQSNTMGFKMPAKYTDWFTECFGFDVVFVYIGQNYRPVLGALAPNAATRNPHRRAEAENKKNGNTGTTSWISSFVNNMPGLPSIWNSENKAANNSDDNEDYWIPFSDCSPYLIVSQTSLYNVSERLPDGEEMDITKFRPNIIVEGAENPWEEDFWGEIQIGSSSLEDAGDSDNTVNLSLTSNCLRCVSITVDYDTGEFAKDGKGQVYKKLQSDRRIDPGHKYSPAFGRYGFFTNESIEAGKDHFVVSVGDQVSVTKLNKERTVFAWPGIGATPKTDLFPIVAN